MIFHREKDKYQCSYNKEYNYQTDNADKTGIYKMNRTHSMDLFL